jgi:acetyl esterase/lipase
LLDLPNLDESRSRYSAQLDVYHPPPTTRDDSRKPPILLFVYGGSFVDGSRSFAPQHLVYNNVGAYFALHGIMAAIADYRRVPASSFPAGSQDVRNALRWIVENISSGNTGRIFLLGHSAGGVHVMSMLLLPTLHDSELLRVIRGVALMGVPYEIYNGRGGRLRDTAEKYYGSKGKIAPNQPLGLLKRVSPDVIAALPQLRNLLAESEPRMIKRANVTFLESYRAMGGAVEEFVLEGHDHSSPLLALCTGYGERWAEELVRWIVVPS